LTASPKSEPKEEYKMFGFSIWQILGIFLIAFAAISIRKRMTLKRFFRFLKKRIKTGKEKYTDLKKEWDDTKID
jgi:hypothetical protein